jgi:hypothetical protein
VIYGYLWVTNNIQQYDDKAREWDNFGGIFWEDFGGK